jgi:NitT/TauT family transport system substrate-binding protein
MQIIQSRRDFMASASLAAAAGVLGGRGSLADEGPLETTTIRLPFTSNICTAPAYIADELLRAEGFTEIRHVASPGGFSFPQMAGRGEIDFGASFAGTVAWMPACRSRRWRGCTPGATSCSPTSPSAPSAS